MLLGASQIGSSTSMPYAFTSMRPQRQRVLPITAAVKVRPPAKRSTPKQAGGRAAPRRGVQQGRGSSPSRGGLGGLFGGAKKAASAPKQAAKKVASSAKKVAPAGTRRVGGTKKVGTKRVGGTSKIGTKRTGVAPPPSGRIQFDEDTSSTLGAAGVFSLGLATSAFLLFSVFTGIEGPAEAEQVVQGAASAVQSIVRSGVNEVGTLAASDSPAEQEDTKIADLAEKAKKAAEQVPSDARSAPSPQVGDASPTGKAGIFGFGKQDPSKAEDTQVPNVGEGANKALGQKSTPTSTSIGSARTNEVAKVAENPIEAAVEKTEEAAESAVKKVPSPNGLVENVEEAIEGTSTFKATAPVGSEGKVSNLADQGLKGGSKFEEAAAKLSGNSTQQFQASTELDKQLQKEDDFKRAAQLKADAPGSDAGNSVIGRLQSQITSKGASENPAPQAPSSSFGPGAAGTKNPGRKDSLEDS